MDAGKSTLSDRLLELTGALKKNSGKTQVLDTLTVEKERGITVKANCVSLLYRYNNEIYMINITDTPGHIDFSNEVARSLTIASSGAVLLIDANHGIQAQTLANYELAVSKNLKIIPVINKIDLKNANPEKVTEDLLMMLNIDPDDVLKISAKLGTGVEEVLHHVINKIPHPQSDRSTSLFRGHLIDSHYDRYRGALNLMLIKDGEICLDQEIQSYETGKTYTVRSLSIMTPDEIKTDRLKAGQIGLIGCNMRNSKDAIIGDTYFLKNTTVEPLQSFKKLQPLVFAGIYPQDNSQHLALKNAIEKLVLNDSCVTVQPDTSPALGHGFRLGFLGLLHMEVFSQRLEQEHDSTPIITAPNVTYKIKIKEIKGILTKYNGKSMLEISNPKFFPDPNDVEEYFEPTVIATIITPQQYLGRIISLCVEKRGIQQSSINLDNDRILLKYIMPLNEVILDFHDHIKSLSSGFASFDYVENDYVSSNLVKLEILLNSAPVDELSMICHSRNVELRARELALKLKELIPRQMVEIRIQACVGSKVIARETIKAFRKDVTQWLYGGDVTRRKKLLKQQAEGKKKMRMIANINVPRDTFIKVLKR